MKQALYKLETIKEINDQSTKLQIYDLLYKQQINLYQMDNSEIVKKRLVDLKQLSQQLKDSSTKQEIPNVNIIKAIMALTKDYSKYEENVETLQNNQTGYSRNNSVAKLFAMLQNNNIHTPQKNNKQFRNSPDKSLIRNTSSRVLQNKNSQRSFKKTSSKNYFSSKDEQQQFLFPENSSQNMPMDLIMKIHKSSMNQQSHANLSQEEQQIIQLRQENIQLEQQAKQLRQQIQFFNKKHMIENQMRKKNEKQWSQNLPYFKRQQTNLAVFVTRLNINEKDYNKIDYNRSRVTLSLDKLTVFRQKNLKQMKSHEQEQQWQMYLQDLVAVNYLDNNKTNGNTSMNQNISIDNRNSPKSKKHKFRILLIFHTPLKFKNLNKGPLQDNNISADISDSDEDEERSQFSRVFVFIDFDDQDSFLRWDLSLYMNYKLIKCLDAIHENQNLFTLQESPKHQQTQTHKQIQNTKQQQQEHNIKQEQLLMMINSNNTSIQQQTNRQLTQGNHQYKYILKDYLQKKEQFQKAQQQLKKLTLDKINETKKRKKQATSFVLAENTKNSILQQQSQPENKSLYQSKHGNLSQSDNKQPLLIDENQFIPSNNNNFNDDNDNKVQYRESKQSYRKINYEDLNSQNNKDQQSNENKDLFSKWKKQKNPISKNLLPSFSISQKKNDQVKQYANEKTNQIEYKQNTQQKNNQESQVKDEIIKLQENNEEQTKNEIERQQARRKQQQQQLQKIEQQKKQQQLKKQQDLKKQKQEEQRQKILLLQQQLKLKKIQEQKKIDNQAIQWLRNGLLLTKYAKGGFNPHEKKVFVQTDNKRFCWIDRGSKDAPKSILLSQIQQINIGEIGPGIQKHIDKKKLSKNKCFVVIHSNNKDHKILEFGAKSQLAIKQFSEKLERLKNIL